ncbi:hypothetical protein [Rhizobium sp.]|uniref:hypothetical protein n=1 Tax=Rhizobium sp. TaxID=391 RepID=UPI0034C6BA7B
MIRVIVASNAAHTVFPDQDVKAVLTYVRAVWDELKASVPRWWNERLETTLVSGLFAALKNDERQMAHGIGQLGKLVLEAVDVDIVAGMPKQRGRTDIRFLSNVAMGPDLVLEFKHLKNQSSALRAAYVKNGIDRFVTGKYSPESDFGVMVGLISGTATNEKLRLLKYLSRKQTVAKTGAKAMNFPAYGDPSSNAPALDFDTLHDRKPHCPAAQIRIGHMLLER